VTGRVGTTGLCVPVSKVRPVMNESMDDAGCCLLSVAWNVAPHWDITTDFDWTRAGIHNEGHKQTSDAGAFSVGAAWRF